MKYLILLVVVIAVWLAIHESSAEKPPGEPEAPQQAESVGEAAGSEAANSPEEDEEALEGLSRPSSSDPLVRSLAGILGDLVHGRLGADDRLDLEARLLEAFAEEGLADELTMQNASRSTAERLLEEMRKARAQGAAAAPPAQTDMVVQAMAARMAGQLRRALSLKGDGRPHEGNFFTVGFDFEAPKGYTKIDWGKLGGFDYREGMTLPEAVRALDGKKIAVAGYMMAMGEFEDIHVFALVESQWSCCFGIPPNINQVIEVTIPDVDEGIELIAQPILVYGILDAGEKIEDEWVVNLYRIDARGVEILDVR